MNIVRVIELALIALIIVFFITQVLVPAWRSRPLFPVFRRQRKLLGQLTEAQEAKDAQQIERAVSKLKQ